MNKLVDFIKRLGDFFGIMCPKCSEKGIRSRMDKNYYIPGIPDSIYWTCKNVVIKKILTLTFKHFVS